MILCHKCSGVLSYSTRTEDVTGLYTCRCISGWVRGFEPILTRNAAIAAQVRMCKLNIALYARQGREPEWIEEEQKHIDRLMKLSMRTVKVMNFDMFTTLAGVSAEEAYDSASHVFSFDDTLVSVGRLCAVLGIAVPDGLDDIFIGLGS